MGNPEQPVLHFVADEAIARCFEMLNSASPRSWPVRRTGRFWDWLKPTTRCVWCQAACLRGDHCLLAWSALSAEDRTALYMALNDMVHFFQEAADAARLDHQIQQVQESE